MRSSCSTCSRSSSSPVPRMDILWSRWLGGATSRPGHGGGGFLGSRSRPRSRTARTRRRMPAPCAASRSSRAGRPPGRRRRSRRAGATSNQPPGLRRRRSTAAPGPSRPPAPPRVRPARAANGAKRESIVNYEVDKTGACGARRRRRHQAHHRRRGAQPPVGDGRQGKTTTTPLSAEQIRAHHRPGARDGRFKQGPRRLGQRAQRALRRGEAAGGGRAGLAPARGGRPCAASPGPAGMVALAALLLMGVVRPALKACRSRCPPAPGGQVDAVVADETERPPLLAAPSVPTTQIATQEQIRLEDARKLARQSGRGGEHREGLDRQRSAGLIPHRTARSPAMSDDGLEGCRDSADVARRKRRPRCSHTCRPRRCSAWARPSPAPAPCPRRRSRRWWTGFTAEASSKACWCTTRATTCARCSARWGRQGRRCSSTASCRAATSRASRA